MKNSVESYHLLGRSGLRVSPLCLGTMTFGTEWGWGVEEKTARTLFDCYLATGGNFVDTADFYTAGHSEELLGKFLQETGKRDRVVVATKFAFNTESEDPNAGGNGRKNIVHALEGSLRRLRSDYVDVYYLHAWDTITPMEEVLYTLSSLVRQGKIRYFGLSDVPAWYAASLQGYALAGGLERACVLQLQYSLTERTIEREHVPAAVELGMAICTWGPLDGGLLSGKYQRQHGKTEVAGSGRLTNQLGARNPVIDRFAEHKWKVVDELIAVARELHREPAQVALNWVTKRPGVAATTIGATRLEQLESNLAALDFEMPEELAARLEATGRPEVVFPYTFFQPEHLSRLTGRTQVRREPRWFRG